MHTSQIQVHLERGDTVTVSHGSAKGSYWIGVESKPAEGYGQGFEMVLFCRDAEHQADVLEAITNSSFNAFIRVPVEQKTAQASVLPKLEAIQEAVRLPSMVEFRSDKDLDYDLKHGE